MLKGIDISEWQGTVSFDILKSNTDFIFIRSSYGTGYTDKCFTENCKQVRSLKIPHGFYHYAYPTYNTPEAEADWFTHVVGILEKGEILALDFEEAYPTPVDWCLRFLDKLSANYGGYKPIIYLNKHITQSYDWHSVIEKDYGLWLAYWDYGTGDAPDTAWDFVAFRQYTNQAQVDGVSGRVDGNVFYGDLTAFYKYGFPKITDPCQAEIVKLREDLAKMEEWGNGWKIKAENRQTIIEQMTEDYKKLQLLAEDWEKKYGQQMEIATDSARDLEIAQNTIDSLNIKISNLEKEIARLKAKKYTTKEAWSFLLASFKK